MVRIHYREPTYEMYVGKKARPYQWTYRVSAESPQQAKTRALAEFKEMARASNVGWKREIVTRGVLEIGLVENIVTFDNSPDFGVHVGYTRRF